MCACINTHNVYIYTIFIRTFNPKAIESFCSSSKFPKNNIKLSMQNNWLTNDGAKDESKLIFVNSAIVVSMNPFNISTQRNESFKIHLRFSVLHE